VVDNTFSPLIFTPAQEGADVVVHSLAKFINGMNDCVAIPYPGLETHPQYQLMNAITHKNNGSGGLFVIDLKEKIPPTNLWKPCKKPSLGI
jgi:cystathionine beta-lyase/cystathionine gamma-synthase